MEQLTTLFLVASLFFPRLSLLILWLQGMVPPNPTHLLVDILLTAFVPRIMVLVLIAASQGYSTWFWIHLIVMILMYLKSGTEASNYTYGRAGN